MENIVKFNSNFIKKLYNAPIKKCIITKGFFPMTFMQRFIIKHDIRNKEVLIPDSLYSSVNKMIKKSEIYWKLHFLLSRYTRNLR